MARTSRALMGAPSDRCMLSLRLNGCRQPRLPGLGTWSPVQRPASLGSSIGVSPSMRVAAISALIVPALLAGAANSAPDPHSLALAAGYKAAFLCSGLFNAHQTPEQMAADDLEGIYPEYQAAVRDLPAKIDRQAHRVSVAFDARLPPRIAAWRPGLGCSQLPI